MYSIVQWNIQGFNSKYEEYIEIKKKKPAVMCFQETMLGNVVPASPRGYSIYAHSASDQPIPGTGLVCIIRDDVAHYPIPLNTTLQAMAFRIRLRKDITICNMYIQHQNLAFNDIQDLYNQLPKPAVMLGDFNARHTLWGDHQINQRGRTMEDFIMQNDVGMLNNGQPTHFHAQTATESAIDLSIVSSELLIDMAWLVSDCLRGSDHYPIYITDNTEEIELQPRYIIAKADWPLFNTLTYMQLNIEDKNVNELVDIFTNTVQSAAEHSIPQTSGGVRRCPVPWWNAQCTLANAERKRTLRRYQRTRLIADKVTYSRARAKARYIKRQARRLSWQQYVTSINSNTSSTKVWKRINKIRGKYPARNAICILNAGRIEMEQQRVADLMAEHYHAISSNDGYSPEFQNVKERKERLALNFVTNEEKEYNEEITVAEYKAALAQCKDTAPGLDKICYQMLRHLNDSAVEFLLRLYNKIWTESVFPQSWSEALVLSFLKQDKPSTETESYRPIALTNCSCKLLERIVNNRLQHLLERESLLPPEQHGFRKMRGTEDAHTLLQTAILNAFAVKQQLVAVFFDLKKAYDTTWRYGILYALHSAGVRGRMAFFIRNFLSNRRFKALIGNCTSRFYEQEQGVPQGSVLSCSLFSLAINQVISVIPPSVKSSLYVDDLVIYTTGTYIPAIERRLQHAINDVEQWTTQHGFTFAAGKTVAVQFHKRRGIPAEPNLKLRDNNIHFKASKKFLGLFYDQRLNWDVHVEYLRKKCFKTMNIMKVLSNTHWGADRATMLKIYRSLIRSKLDYGCQFYQSAKETVLKRLDPIHNMAIRLSTGAFRSSPVTSLCADSGEPPLAITRNQITMQYILRIKRMPNSLPHKAIFEPEVSAPFEMFSRLTAPVGIIAKRALAEQNLAEVEVLQVTVPDTPPWKTNIHFRRDLCKYPKANTHPTTLKFLFLAHVAEHYSDSYMIYTDGSKFDAGVGCAAFSCQETIRYKLNPNSSIYTAELYAIVAAIQIINNHLQNHRTFTIVSDSRSALQAIETPSADHPIISEIQSSIIELNARRKTVHFCWAPSHVGISGNERADAEAKAAVTDRALDFYRNAVPHKDLRPVIKRGVRDKWQQEWSQVTGTNGRPNKLRVLKDSVMPWPSSCSKNRRHEVILARLRIGHTKLTHGYLMDGRPPSYCQDCLVPLTVKHLLAECPSLHQQRQRYFSILPHRRDADTLMKEILKDSRAFDTERIMEFLKSINVYDRI